MGSGDVEVGRCRSARPFGGVGSLVQAGCVELLGGEPLGGAKQGQTSPSRAKEQLKNHFGS